ncbi:MAG: hypothetical protein ACRD2Z_10535 [Thermoanaerobaculia bacterium]
MRRLVILGAVVIAAIGALAAYKSCSDWDPAAQFAPPLRPAFGARVVDGELELWTGTPCHDVTEVAIVFDSGTAERVRRDLAAIEPGITLETFRPAGDNAGMVVERELPDGFDWRQAETVTFLVEGSDGYWSAEAKIDEVVDGSDDHPEGTYLFQEVGWLDTTAVAEKNGETFLTVCTTAPAEE